MKFLSESSSDTQNPLTHSHDYTLRLLQFSLLGLL